MFCPQLVFLAVILTMLVTCVGGRLTPTVLMGLVLYNGLDKQTLKALDLMMTFPNLDVR